MWLAVLSVPPPHLSGFRKTVCFIGLGVYNVGKSGASRMFFLLVFPSLLILIQADDREGEHPRKFNSVCVCVYICLYELSMYTCKYVHVQTHSWMTMRMHALTCINEDMHIYIEYEPSMCMVYMRSLVCVNRMHTCMHRLMQKYTHMCAYELAWMSVRMCVSECINLHDHLCALLVHNAERATQNPSKN